MACSIIHTHHPYIDGHGGPELDISRCDLVKGRLRWAVAAERAYDMAEPLPMLRAAE